MNVLNVKFPIKKAKKDKKIARIILRKLRNPFYLSACYNSLRIAGKHPLSHKMQAHRKALIIFKALLTMIFPFNETTRTPCALGAGFFTIIVANNISVLDSSNI